MTVLNVLVYVALIGYILYRRVQGQPVKQGRALFVLPVVLIVLGYGDVTHGTATKPLEVTLTVIGGVISLGLGLLRGRADKLSDRDGAPFVQWGTASLCLFAANIAAKVVLDVVGLAAGGSSSAVGKSLILTFGLTLLGEAIVISIRTGGVAGALTRRPAASVPAQTEAPTPWRPPSPRQPVQRPQRPQRETEAPVATTVRDVADALQRHHERHRERHDHHHRDRTP